MDWSRGFSAAYYLAVVDPASWRDVDRIEITSGSITRNGTGLRESADIQCTDYDNNRELWIRVWLDATQGETTEHIPLFTGIACSPSTEIDGNLFKHPLECYSVLKPAQDILLKRGWYAPANANGANLIRTLLSVSPAPVVIDGLSPTLTQTIVAEDGESNLSMADKILMAIGWRLRIDGDGTVHVCPKATEESATFDALENDVIEPQLSVDQDWYECPNVFRAVLGNLTAEARDENPDSFLSIVTRGREVWKEETSAALNSGETIAEYAMRRLREEQSYAVSVSYYRRYVPEVYVGDIVRLHHPAQGLDGDFVVQSQTITLSYGARVSERVST